MATPHAAARRPARSRTFDVLEREQDHERELADFDPVIEVDGEREEALSYLRERGLSRHL